jgi:OmcA/MtrC family decaheme c-type cytochrome
MDKRFSRRWLGLIAAGAFATLLSACGSDGSDGAPGPAGPPGPSGPTSVDVGTIAPEQWENANFKAEVTSVVITGAPVVSFTVTDDKGLPVVGLEKVTSKSDSATVASYPNVQFALAKLVPSDANNPSEWKSYIVTAVPTTSTAKDANGNFNIYPGRPTTDNTGTLQAVADQPGSYTYTFWRDVPNIKAQVAAAPEQPVSSNYPSSNKADLGDLTFDSSLPHRLVVQISGAAPGTGTNTLDGKQVTAGVNMANPVNAIYDFKPGAAGAPGTAIPPDQLTREDVNIASCNVCHEKLAFHGGSARVETRYCVACHTEQRAYGQNRVTSTSTATALAFPALKETKTVNSTTGIASYSYSPQTAVADGEVAGNFTTMIHKIHQGNWLVKDNYNYANVAFNKKGFSKLGGGQRMCSTCHDSNIASTANNHKEKPTRVSCGACHDGINWATGGGSTLADKQNATYPDSLLAQSGHEGRAQADDSKCTLCHTPAYVPYDHRLENITKNNPGVLPGLASFKYEIKSSAVNGNNDVTIVFRVLKGVSPTPPAGSFLSAPAEADYTPVTFVAPAPSVSAPLAGFTGSPAFLLAFATTQDGITTPSDFNNSQTIKVNDVPVYIGTKQQQPMSVSVAQLLSTNNAATIGSMSGPDGSGYYTATILGNGAAVCGGNGNPQVKCSFPVGAKMRTVALQSYFTQVGAPTDNVGGTGNVARHAISVVNTVTGDTARRTIVNQEKCAACHEWFEGHGGNRVKETQVCVMCHNTGLATSGKGIADSVLLAYNANTAANTPTPSTGAFTRADRSLLADWTFFSFSGTELALKFPVTSNNFKDMIHGIHAGRDRVTPFQDARDRAPGAIALLDFRRMDFPGKLNNCEACHVTGTNTATTYNSVPAGALVSTHESINADFANTKTTVNAKASLNTKNDQDLVTTPFAAACVSCHDNSAAKAHIDINGGSVLTRRDVAQKDGRPLEDVESCAVCHGPGRSVDAAVVHK